MRIATAAVDGLPARGRRVGSRPGDGIRPAAGPEGARQKVNGADRRGWAGGTARGPARGFSLLEALVVLAILLVLFSVGASMISRQTRTAALIGTSNALEGLVQRARIEMQRRGHVVFLRVREKDAGGQRQVELWEDTNDNRTLQAGSGDVLINERPPGGVADYVIPQTVSLSRSDVDAIQQSGWEDGGSGRIVIGVDFLGRAFTPGTGRQIAAVATLTVTHASMVTGGASPMVDYQLRINPVWNASTRVMVQGTDF